MQQTTDGCSIAMHRPGLAVISLATNGGGVAYVGRLLQRVLRDGGADPWIAELGVERRDRAGLRARARFAMTLVGARARGRVDWMLFNHAGVARAQRTMPGFLRIPYGVFVHDVEAWDPGIDRGRLETLAAARVLIANSEYTARRVASTHAGLRVAACPLGLLPDETPHRSAAGEMPQGSAPTALIVGRIMADERYKGHDQLIEAWPAVRAAVPDAELVVAGWGDDIARLQAKAAALSLGNAVRFTGYVSDATLAALFARASVYAMPSAREGFGLVYLEAMRSGVPCIGSTLDAASEVIAHGESGFIVNRENPRELVGALTSLLGDPLARGTMGAAGRRRFESRFTYDHFRERLLPIVHGAFEAPATARGPVPTGRLRRASAEALRGFGAVRNAPTSPE